VAGARWRLIAQPVPDKLSPCHPNFSQSQKLSKIDTLFSTTYSQPQNHPSSPPAILNPEVTPMSSRQKRKQARQNGALAAGTKSPEGIKQSSMNALAHGLTSKSLVLTNESKPAYDRLRLEYVNRFQPQDGVEMDLVDDMVGARWRLRRIAIMQTAALDLQMDRDEAEIKKGFKQIDQPTLLVIAFGKLADEGHSLQLLLRYETTYSRMYDRAMKTLYRLQKDRHNITEVVEESTTCDEPATPADPGVTKPPVTANRDCETTLNRGLERPPTTADNPQTKPHLLE